MFKILAQSYKSKILRKVLSSTMVICLLFSNIYLLGFYIVDGFTSYAIDTEHKNSIKSDPNVEFDAYFKPDGNKTYSLVSNINDETNKLYIDIAVKNAGRLKNAKISLKNKSDENNINYKMIGEINSTNVNSTIESVDKQNNEIILRQIDANTTTEMYISIGLEKSNEIELAKLNQESKVILNGIYVNNEGVEKEIIEEINLNVGWEVEEEPEVELSQKLISFTPYSYQDEEKIKKGVIAELEVLQKQKFENEQKVFLPKQTKIELNPIKINNQLPIEVNVIARTTKGTNGNKQIFTADNWKQNLETGTLTITVKNETDNQGKIYAGEGQDIFYITYKYGEDEYNYIKELEEISELKLQSNINSEIELYSLEETEKTKKALNEVEYIFNDEENGLSKSGFGSLVSVEAVNTEKVTKGAIYANTILADKNYKTEYKTNLQIKVAETELINNIILTEKEKIINSNNTEYSAKVKYNKISISKENFKEILGEDGFIKILGNQGEELSIINNPQVEETNTNNSEEQVIEEINYEIELDDSVALQESIVIKTSKPIKPGFLNLEICKTIDSETKIEEEKILNSQAKIFESIKSIFETKIESVTEEQDLENVLATTILEETKTEAIIKIEPENLSTTQINNNINLTVDLNNNTENSDLHKNPEFTIQFPDIVEYFEVNNSTNNLVYGNGLSIESMDKIENQKALKINLTGTQAEYMLANSTQILLSMNIKLKNTTPTTTEDVILTYTNENVIEYEEINSNNVGIAKAQIKTNVPQNILDKIEIGEDVEELTSNIKITRGGQEITSDTVLYEQEIIKYTITLQNTGLVELNNISIKSTPDGLTIIEPDEDGEEWFKNAETQTIAETCNIPVGESVIREYELKINKIDNGQTKNITNTIEILDSKNNSKLKYTIENTVNKAKLEITIIDTYKNGLATQGTKIEYCFNIKNITEDEINSIEAKIELPETLEYSSSYNSKYDVILPTVNNNSIVWDIGTLLPNEDISMRIYATASEKIDKNTVVSIYAQTQTLEDKNKVYTSNEVTKLVQYKGISANLECETEGRELKVGDTVIYTLTINNSGNTAIYTLEVNDILPEEFEAISIKSGNQNGFIFGNELEYNTSLDKDETQEIIIEAKVKEALKLEKDEQIENFVTISEGKIIKQTNTILHSIKANYVKPPVEDNEQNNNENDNTKPEENSNNENENTKPEENSNTNPDNTKTTYKISGLVWLDENKNGEREDKESKLKEIEVKLYNAKTNKQLKQIKTNENGIYEFTELETGVYTIEFKYDENNYVITEYQKLGLNSAINSDVIPTIPAITDVIEIKATDVQNVDLGLKIKEKFDLSLNKYVSKITVQNEGGTTITNYENSTLAKASIKGKNLTGSTVVVEYKIVVKNNGDVPGYATKIVDYLPKDLKFSSELNKSWYLDKDGNIYTDSLKDTIINPEEQKEVLLILTKKMTEENTGLTNNLAEICESYNDFGLADINSTPANKVQKENDLGSADILIEVSTGGTMLYISITITSMIILTVGIYLIKKEVIDKDRTLWI